LAELEKKKLDVPQNTLSTVW